MPWATASHRLITRFFLARLVMPSGHNRHSLGSLSSSWRCCAQVVIRLTIRLLPEMVQMLLLVSVPGDLIQTLPPGIVDPHHWFLEFSLFVHVLHLHFQWRRYFFVVFADASHEIFVTITVGVTIFSEDVESSEDVLTLIQTHDLNEQGQRIENNGRFLINWISLQSYMVHGLRLFGGLLEHPLHLRL